jgi:hypothetical protein
MREVLPKGSALEGDRLLVLELAVDAFVTYTFGM